LLVGDLELPLLDDQKLLAFLQLLLEEAVLVCEGVDFGALLFQLVEVHALYLDVESMLVDVIEVGLVLQRGGFAGFC
jgi:hypothetical protein